MNTDTITHEPEDEDLKGFEELKREAEASGIPQDGVLSQKALDEIQQGKLADLARRPDSDTYTVDLQNCPGGAAAGIEQLIARLKGTDATIVVKGDGFGYRENIKSITDAGIRLIDKTRLS